MKRKIIYVLCTAALSQSGVKQLWSKTRHLLTGMAMAALLLTACEKEDDRMATLAEGMGQLELSLGFDIKNTGGRIASESVDTAPWSVTIYDSAGAEVLRYPDYSAVPAEIELAAGDYAVTVDSESNPDSVAFDHPHYAGTETFTIVGGDVTAVTVTASLTNVKVTMTYSDRVKDNFSDYSTSVTSASGTLLFDSAEVRSGYFPAGESLSLEATLKFTRADGQTDTYTVTHTLDSTAANDHYEVTLDCELENGTLTPLLIAVAPTNDIPIDLCCVTSDTARVTFARNFGGSGSDNPFSMHPTPDGGYIFAGRSSSTNGDITNPKGGDDYWIVKLDDRGNLLWQKSYGGSGDDNAFSIHPTPDGGYIATGYSESADGDITDPKGGRDYWIIKLDDSGNLLWQKSLGGSGEDIARSIHPTLDGGYIVAGFSLSTDGDITDPKGGVDGGDYWIVKLDNSGDLLWQKSLGGSGRDYAHSIRSTSDGGYIVVGSSRSTDGDITHARGREDYWIVKLDGSGNLLWQKSLGGGISDGAQSIYPTPDGGYIVAGNSWSTDGDITHPRGENDYWIVKIDGSGNLLWQKSLGGSVREVANAIRPTPDGGYIVAGYSASTDGDITNPKGGGDCWIVKLGGSGNLLWQKSYGGSSGDGVYSIHTTPDGGYVFAGHSWSADGDITDPKGAEDCWIVKLDADGNL